MLRKTLVIGALLGYYTSTQIKTLQQEMETVDAGVDDALLEQKYEEAGTEPFEIE